VAVAVVQEGPWCYTAPVVAKQSMAYPPNTYEYETYTHWVWNEDTHMMEVQTDVRLVCMNNPEINPFRSLEDRMGEGK